MRAAAHHQGEQAVGVSAETSVGFAVLDCRAVGLTDGNRYRYVVLVEYQLVLCVAHHRLVGQLLIDGHLRESTHQSSKQQDEKE